MTITNINAIKSHIIAETYNIKFIEVFLDTPLNESVVIAGEFLLILIICSDKGIFKYITLLLDILFNPLYSPV